ncbi:MAG: cytochrome c-type biogenesis protein CcmH [Hyphomicrobiales bacterium]
MFRSVIIVLAATLFLGGAMVAVRAVEPGELLDDPVLEQRAREISKNLRCLVCQNQSIDESNADLARDLRIIVRKRLVAGDSDENVIGFIVARYGDWVLLRPPFKPKTWLLWFGPFGIAGIAGFMYWGFYRRQPRLEDDPVLPLAKAEQERLEKVLGQG